MKKGPITTAGRAQSGSKQSLNVGRRRRNPITEMHSSNLAQELFYSFFGGGRNEWNHAYLGKENGVFQAYLHLQVQFQFEVGTNGAEK